MAQELSQAEVLDFLCQAGGRVANAALLSYFKGFLREPGACPVELQHRRELFKGFVNSVATVRQEGPEATKYVVLRKRYRELVGEEAKAPAVAAGESRDAQPPPTTTRDLPAAARRLQSPGRAPRAPRAQEKGGGGGGAACRREPPRPQVGAERTCPGPAPGLGRRRPDALLPPPSTPFQPSGGGDLLGAGDPGQGDLGQAKPGAPRPFRAETPPPPPPLSNGLDLPVGETGAPPRDAGAQQRIRDWVATHHCAYPDPLAQEADRGWPAARSTPPTASVGSEPGDPLASPDAQWDPVPVFRSIRCQLSLQDLEDFLEQESSASDGSSASGGSDSYYRGRGESGVLRRLLRRHKGRGRKAPGGAWAAPPDGPCLQPHPDGLGVLTGKEGSPHQNGTIPEHHNLLSWIAGRAFPSGKPWGKDPERQGKGLPQTKKVARLPPPNLDAPLISPRLIPRQSHEVASTRDVKGQSLDAEGLLEQRSTLVPLEPREHAWLVKVATGSWMQARALFLEDPQLATRKDFVSGYTVLHWLAKHGNAQALQDFVTGARKAGVTLDVNAKSGCGYTPLHLAAMHGHQPVMEVLVQKLQCCLQIRDSSGKRPWQYLGTATSGEVWRLLGAPRGKTIFPARPITRNSSPPARKGKSPELARKISRKASLAAYLKPQHIKWKMANKCPPLQEREEYSD
ncbi:hypothetical protein JRQ81_016973 [Phrynocephalus forsythii]|uniref:SOWAHA-C winged helix-turn-helix domain-containing protein n=1 Tax=Phrynocephalus forsythii TaxID=171643 RepID=A0A9Q0XWK2_9SAUR|nr:hypothetical protein JRQ81_016973 [Phrynocephalus forsythii]